MVRPFLLCFDFLFFIMRLSGRILKLLRIRSRTEIVLHPSMLAFLVSRETRFCAYFNCSSALSSIVTIRSSGGIACDSAFKNVVFPLPVPPLIKMLYRHFTNSSRKLLHSSVIDPSATSLSSVIPSSGNRRIVIAGPFNAIGESTTFTREPSESLASRIGDASLTTRLQPAAIC